MLELPQPAILDHMHLAVFALQMEQLLHETDAAEGENPTLTWTYFSDGGFAVDFGMDGTDEVFGFQRNGPQTGRTCGRKRWRTRMRKMFKVACSCLEWSHYDLPELKALPWMG